VAARVVDVSAAVAAGRRPVEVVTHASFLLDGNKGQGRGRCARAALQTVPPMDTAGRFFLRARTKRAREIREPPSSRALLALFPSVDGGLPVPASAPAVCCLPVEAEIGGRRHSRDHGGQNGTSIQWGWVGARFEHRHLAKDPDGRSCRNLAAHGL
jgi:hypothetical protein